MHSPLPTPMPLATPVQALWPTIFQLESLALTPSQRQNVDHLSVLLPEIKEKIIAALALAERAKRRNDQNDNEQK